MSPGTIKALVRIAAAIEEQTAAIQNLHMDFLIVNNAAPLAIQLAEKISENVDTKERAA
jgi:hypothetical protein